MHPHNSGSLYINYKGVFCIVLMALADYDYKLLFLDIGCQGRISDGGVFRNCVFYGALVRNELNLPLPTEVPPLNPGWNFTEPCMKSFCMKSYPLTGLTEEERLFSFRTHFHLISDALTKTHLGYGAIDSAYFQQEFACNLKKLHHAPSHQSRYTIF